MSSLPPLYEHQSLALPKAIKAGGTFAFFHDPGTGKTRTNLELFKYYKTFCRDLKLFVVCPPSLIKSAWIDDIERFTDFKYVRYVDFKKKGRSLTEDIVLINYELLVASKSVRIGRRVRRDYYHLPHIIKLLSSHSFMASLDESCKLQDPKSLTTKTLHMIKHLFEYRIVGTGTAWAISEMELWGQILFITDDAFSDNFFAFRNRYFHLERNGQLMQGQVVNRAVMQQLMKTGWKYAITPQNRIDLFKAIEPYVDWVDADDVLDLPPERTEKRDVYLSLAETKAYKQMKNDLILELNNQIITGEVALKKCMKLRQATSGFMYDEEKVPQRFGSSKTKVLRETLLEFGTKHVLIWYQFTEELHDIMRLFDKESKSYTYISGEQKNKDDAIADFKHGRVQYCIAHPKSAAHGHTFIKCHVEIFYCMDGSFRYHKQGKKRIRRIGQEHPCLYIYLLGCLQGKSPATIDHECMATYEGRQTQQDIVGNLLRG